VGCELRAARELGGQLVSLASRLRDPRLGLEAHRALCSTLCALGEFPRAREHGEQSLALYDPRHLGALASLYGFDPVANSVSWLAVTLWYLGYPAQALERSQEALALARQVAQAYTIGTIQSSCAMLRQLRREGPAAQEEAEAALRVTTAQGLPLPGALAASLRGWALVEQGHLEEGIAQMRQGVAAWRATGAELFQSHLLTLLAEAYGKRGQAEQGLAVLAEALAYVDRSGEQFYEAELYRLKGELRLQQLKMEAECTIASSQAEADAEACFLRAIELARKQHAKSWELRAATSLARLWQHQGKTAEAHQMLSEIYGWFTEGFDTKDLQEAKALLEELT
jgi:predicted ATPase